MSTYLKWSIRLLPFIAAVGAPGLLYKLGTNADNRETGDATSEEKTRRSLARGTIASISGALIMNIIGAIMAARGIPESYIVTNYGFFLGPVIGYMMDIGFGTDAGYRNKFKKEGFIKVFKSLWSGNFLRYIITVLLDLFISSPLQDVIKDQLSGIRGEFSSGNFYDRFISKNFPSILQSIVGFITFNAYTNQTRFKWAYPSPDMPMKERIPSSTISLSMTIAGILFLLFYKTLSHTIPNINMNEKLIYVIVGIIILYYLNNNKIADAPYEDDKKKLRKMDKEAEKMDYKVWLGAAVFGFFVFYGFIIPFTKSGGKS